MCLRVVGDPDKRRSYDRLIWGMNGTDEAADPASFSRNEEKLSMKAKGSVRGLDERCEGSKPNSRDS